MNYKEVDAAKSTITRNTVDIDSKTGNIYEAIAIISKRSNQIALEMKEELNGKLAEFATTTDNLDEVFENREQIEISKFYEKLPNPVIISTTGIIEGPAKPKQYYMDIITNISKESIEEIKKKYKGEFLEYNDPRLPDIVEGILLQIIFYYETGDAFCDNSQCRLFNAHWQKDLFISQIKNQSLCNQHSKILNEMKNNT